MHWLSENFTFAVWPLWIEIDALHTKWYIATSWVLIVDLMMEESPANTSFFGPPRHSHTMATTEMHQQQNLPSFLPPQSTCGVPTPLPSNGSLSNSGLHCLTNGVSSMNGHHGVVDMDLYGDTVAAEPYEQVLAMSVEPMAPVMPATGQSDFQSWLVFAWSRGTIRQVCAHACVYLEAFLYFLLVSIHRRH